ncbi:hypothetical protein QTP88_004689 [Uroleucon formosanum]
MYPINIYSLGLSTPHIVAYFELENIILILILLEMQHKFIIKKINLMGKIVFISVLSKYFEFLYNMFHLTLRLLFFTVIVVDSNCIKRRKLILKRFVQGSLFLAFNYTYNLLVTSLTPLS